MFPVHIMNPFVEQRRQGCCPRFARTGSRGSNQHVFWPFVDSRCGNHQYNTGPMSASPIAALLQKLQETQHTEKEQRDSKESQTCKKQEKCSLEGADNQRKTPQRVFSFQPIGLNDLINTTSAQYVPWSAKESGKWQQKVDCRGFESKNIKVKIDTHELLIKAFKKEKIEDRVNTSSLRRRIVLPKNIDNKKITCKLSSNGILLVEAPLLDKDNKNNQRKCITDLMSMMLPGWKEFLKEQADSDNVAPEKENKEKNDKSSKEHQEESNNKNPIVEMMSMMLPGWKELLKAQADSDNVASEKEDEEKNDKSSKEHQEESNNKNPIVEMMSMMLPGWKEFLDQNCADTKLDKENVENSAEKSKDFEKNEDKIEKNEDEIEKNEDTVLVPETSLANQEDENSSTGQEHNDSVVYEISEMAISENDNLKDEATTTEKNNEENKEQLCVVFENDKQDSADVLDHEVDDDDDDSDSFVLLSQLEDERAEGDKDSLRNDATENIEEDRGNVLESNDAGSDIVESNDLTIKESESHNVIHNFEIESSHKMIDDSESESNKRWEFRLEMPSYKPESLQVSFDENKRLLQISATQDHNSDEPVSTVKSVHVSDNVDVNDLQCSFRDGLLSVTAPYMKTLRSIPISV